MDKSDRKDRTADFKKGLNAEEMTQKRAQQSVKIRKERKQMRLKRVRKLRSQNANGGGDGDGDGDEHGGGSVVFEAEFVRSVVIGMQTGSDENRSAALQKLLEVTSSDTPHLGLLHDMKIVQVLQKFLMSPNMQDQMDALWCYTNLASGMHETTEPLYPVLPHLVHLLAPENAVLAEQAAWCLGNISVDCSDCRRKVVAVGAAVPLVNLLKLSGPPDLFCTLGFSLVNLLRGGDNQGVSEVMVRAGILPLTLRLMSVHQPPEVVLEMAWVLTYLSAHVPAATAIVKLGGVDLIIQLLQHAKDNHRLLVPLLRIIGNIANGPDALMAAIMKSCSSFLKTLWQLLSCADTAVKKELCWTLSNISAGPPMLAEAIFDAGFVPHLCGIFNNSGFSVKKECAYVLLNMCYALAPQFLSKLIETPGVMSSFVELINGDDIECIGVGLKWASLICKKLPNGPAVFESHGGLLALEDLEYNTHKNEHQFRKANDLLDRYFTHFDDDEEDNAQMDMEFPAWRNTNTKQPSNQNFSF